MKNPYEIIEEWLFRLRRPSSFYTVPIATERARCFRELIEKLECPACKQKKLEVDKFERGPKGWEVDISCENCNFKAFVNSKSTVMVRVSSKGKAVDGRRTPKASRRS